jgi:hypothetical protein
MPAWYYFTRPTNLACHNLCTIKQPPLNFRSLLGLGLNFCPRPRYTNFNITKETSRFTTDIYTKAFMADKDKAPPRLHLRSGWTPPLHLVNNSLQRRTGVFLMRTKRLFQKRKVRSNLLPHQRFLLRELRNNKDFVIIQADKNLGPCILERDIYIKKALSDHLLDTNTYQQLTAIQRQDKIIDLKFKLQNFIETYEQKLDKVDIKFLQRSSVVQDPLPKFYLTAKVHKKPWKTRPIISLSGSLLHGLGQWTDKILQPVVRKLPSFVASAVTLKELLIALGPLPPNATIGTCDAVSMYTNIETTHALRQVRTTVRTASSISKYEKIAVLHALEIIMRNNTFDFGNTTWLQIDGTAMGVSPSCCYAMIYFTPHEEEMKKKYSELFFYKRYIDDVFYIWVPHSNSSDDLLRWESFKKDMNKFGKLKWEFSARSREINFLDMIITLQADGTFSTRLYEKDENKYLYLPKHSCHPPGNLKGLIYGAINRILRTTSDSALQQQSIQQLYTRLLARGYGHTLLKEVLNKTFASVKTATATSVKNKVDMKHTVVLHLQYHPCDPPSKVIQQLFREELHSPVGLTQLQDLQNHNKVHTGINRLLIAYHRPPNIGNLLSPRVLKSDSGPLVSSYID